MRFWYRCLLLCWLASPVQAQWTERDSLWLSRILAGKDTLRLNPEFQRAIEQGSFLIPEGPQGEMRMAEPNGLPITKDFSEYLRSEDSTYRKVALKDLPPSVFWWHEPKYKKILPVYKSIIEELRRNPSAGGAGGLVSFDLGELTSRKARVHKRNQQRNSTRMQYNELPTPDVISKRKMFLRKQAQARQDSIARLDSLHLPATNQ